MHLKDGEHDSRRESSTAMAFRTKLDTSKGKAEIVTGGGARSGSVAGVVDDGVLEKNAGRHRVGDTDLTFSPRPPFRRRHAQLLSSLRELVVARFTEWDKVSILHGMQVRTQNGQ